MCAPSVPSIQTVLDLPEVLHTLGGRRSAATLFAVMLYAPVFVLSVSYSIDNASTVLINDVSRLNPTRVEKIIQGHELDGIREVLEEAKADDLHVSIAGRRHSMGGHAFYPGGVVLDMTTFDRILAVDVGAKAITVESGATWKQVIETINEHNLSVQVMQAYNGFTVGGALSVNVHESDPNYGPMVETVDSFRLLVADGTVLNVSRTQNSDLFGLVIGGYGLFGVILDVTLRLAPNVVLAKQEQVISYGDYLSTFRGIRNGTEVGQIFARLSIAPGPSLLQEVVVTTYQVTDEDLGTHRDLQEPSTALKKLAFGLSRKYDWAKDLRWHLQKERSDLVDDPTISRNNRMNGDMAFLEYTSSHDTDILQEYFVPVARLPTLVDRLRDIVEANHLNLLSATIRYVPANNESLMSYSRTESFGLVLYFNVGTSSQAQARVTEWTRELVDEAISLGGAFYLPYENYATPLQLRLAYPNTNAFFEAKRIHDPDLLFMNTFYEDYAEP